MDEIHLPAAAVIAANRARVGLQSAGCAEHFANHANHVEPLDDQRHDGGCGDESFQPGIKRLADMFRIMLLGQFRRHTQHLHRHDVQALGFESRENLTHQAALDTVGLEQN